MLIIGKAVEYAQSGGVADAAITPNLLDAGSVGIYAIDPANGMQKLVIVGSSTTGKVTATGFKGKSFRICQGLGGGEFLVSEDIDIKTILSITGSKYAAPTGQTTWIGYNETDGKLNIQDVLGARNEITIGVKESGGFGAEEIKRYYTIRNITSTTTDEEIVDALVAEFNAPRTGEQQFTASKVESGADYGLKLVALDISVAYDISLQGDAIEQADIKTTKPFAGSGTYAKIADIEKISNVYRGDFYSASTFHKHLPLTADSSKTYDTYFIRAINTGLDKTGQKATVDHLVGEPYGGVTVAFEVQGDVLGTNQQADFEDILIALFPATQAISA